MVIQRYLWGESGKVLWLLAASAIVLFAGLGGAELWTQEGRWAAICFHMMRSADYLHPYLYGHAYYDKPLGSYWLMVGAGWVLGGLDETALRVPSALAGLLTVWCVYRLGKTLFDKTTGLMAGFLLATCFMFVFWSRVASADMLNLAGTTAAVTWYFERRERPGFVTFAVLALIVALTCLMKGLIGAVVVGLVLMPDLLTGGRWKTLLRPPLVPAALLGVAVYLLPFMASTLTQPVGYAESGLAMVVKENALRYFDAFDHQEPWWSYLVDLPVYLLPWSILLPFAGWSAFRRWRTLPATSRWPVWSCLLIFALLTASGSRRSYYILPIVPFGVLVIADWLRSLGERTLPRAVAAWGVAAALAAMLLWFGVVVPFGFRRAGERLLVRAVRQHVEAIAPWQEWRILICGAPEAAGYYFRTDAGVTVIPAAAASEIGPLVAGYPHTIVVTKRRFLEGARAAVPSAVEFEEPSRVPRLLRSKHASSRDVIALVSEHP
jgi:4-amino-4-deoxy-L-arabinose transferase-like glycosyltransferase